MLKEYRKGWLFKTTPIKYGFYRRRTYNVLPFQVPLTMSISVTLTVFTAKIACKGKKIF